MPTSLVTAPGVLTEFSAGTFLPSVAATGGVSLVSVPESNETAELLKFAFGKRFSEHVS